MCKKCNNNIFCYCGQHVDKPNETSESTPGDNRTWIGPGDNRTWIDRNNEQPPENIRILIYSPVYESVRDNHEMTFRIVSSDFFSICTEATHWARLVGPAQPETELEE